MADDVEKAIIYAFDQSGAVDAALRDRAVTFLAEAKTSPECWRHCVARYPVTTYPEVRFWCLQTLADALQPSGSLIPGSLSDADASAFRGAIAGWIAEAASRTDPPVPAFVKNKLAQVAALLVKREYPTRWPSFFRDLVSLLRGAANADGADGATDVFCRVLDAIDEEVISAGDTARERPLLGGGESGAFCCTLVPIRPRSRGERHSLRTLPVASLRPPLAFNPRPRRLSTPTAF